MFKQKRNMKKIYMKPETLLEQMELEQMIAASLLDGEADPTQPVLSRDDEFLEMVLNPFEGFKF